MQVRMVQGGETAFNTLVFQQPDPMLYDYLSNNLSRVTNIVGNAGTSFINGAKEMIEKFNNSAAINAAKALIFGMGGHTSQMQVYPLYENNMYQANLIMQQYIMAQPDVNKLHKNNMCYGFQETYHDTEKGVYGTERNDYRAVMDGVVVHEGDESFRYTYSSSSDLELGTIEQYSVLTTWDSVVNMLTRGLDPTSPNENDEL